MCEILMCKVLMSWKERDVEREQDAEKNVEKKQDAERNKMLRKEQDAEKEDEMLEEIRCWVDDRDIDSAHCMSHFSSENSQMFSFVSKFFFFIVESIRLLDSIEVTTFNRVDIAFRHVTSRCRHVAMNQVALRNSNRDRTQRCTRYWCFSNWLIISNEIKFFESKSIDRESVVWWWREHEMSYVIDLSSCN